jgi:REP element-mobilizing transposase RayT
MNEISVYRRRLPHWRMDGVTYFVTWRLRRDQAPLTEAERGIATDTIRFFDGQRYHLFSYVVMDDHVHAVVEPKEGHELQQIMKSWKEFTTTSLHKATGRSMQSGKWNTSTESFGTKWNCRKRWRTC